LYGVFGKIKREKKETQRNPHKVGGPPPLDWPLDTSQQKGNKSKKKWAKGNKRHAGVSQKKGKRGA